nr:MAG TPA: hypothetical protein [Caudoviricetes sp.]
MALLRGSLSFFRCLYFIINKKLLKKNSAEFYYASYGNKKRGMHFFIFFCL